MVTSTGLSPYPSAPSYRGASGGDNVGALQGRIQQARAQLNDWTTCVSAKTPKGQAEIQKFAGEISADKSKIARAQQSQANTPAAVTPDTRTHGPSEISDRRGGLVDLWA